MAAAFRLAGLLRLRRLQEDQAAAELARTHAERRAAAHRRDETAQLLAGTSFPVHGDELVWRAAVAGRASLAGLTTEATAALAAVESRVDQATGEWSAARTRATTLSKLEERHEVLVRAEEEAAEQLVLDEAASRRHQAAQTADPARPDLSAPVTEETR